MEQSRSVGCQKWPQGRRWAMGEGAELRPCLQPRPWLSFLPELSQEHEPCHELHVRDLGWVLLGRVQCLMIRGGANNAEQLQKQMIGSTVDVPESSWTIPVENCLPRNHSPVPESLGAAVLYYFWISFLLFIMALFISGEGNGTPLQYSCLKIP